METRSREGYLKKLSAKLHLKNIFIVPRINSGSELALYWKDDINLKVMNSSTSYINAIVNPEKDDAWWFTGFYGNLVTATHVCLDSIYYIEDNLFGKQQHHGTGINIYLC